MISTKAIMLNPSDLSAEWCFCYLLNISEDLDGKDYKCLSPISEEKTASFTLYKNKSGVYKFKCFSTSQSGDHFDLVVALEKTKGNIIDRKAAKTILKEAYLTNSNRHIVGDRGVDYTPKNGKGRVTDWEMRVWNLTDIEYWEQFEITTDDLEFYNVAPLSRFVIEKLKDGELKKYEFSFSLMFGYFNRDGSLYTIYCPGRKPKFIRVQETFKLLGSSQIVKPARFLIYIKSLKDLIAFKKMRFPDFDCKALPGETIMVPKQQVDADKLLYEKIFVWVDPDKAGDIMAEKYKKEYDLDRIEFNLGPKDLTDSIKEYSSFAAQLHLIQIL